MPYFYFRKYSLLFVSVLILISCNMFLAFFILGIGSGVSLIVFILEQLFVKYFKTLGLLRD